MTTVVPDSDGGSKGLKTKSTFFFLRIKSTIFDS